MKIRERIAKLIDVKSLVTLILTIIFSIQCIRGFVTAEQFQTVFTTVIAFYFGTQYQKKGE